ncbi:haloacid dehalogenase [Actibacterium mucosum KCTC 23349]|uniref:Haloacid dehalogenase n=1 Tax=Actibacterium mucosum KCTC 23349 TaxID=1454373 RepID=A0A037ZMY6_9RHOB|nr:HAD family phosphatase [Actibacterium mucosum]KAJ57000.1 haloacid dehalogenase [Actibacterium mucosum KCTC 23349]
MTRPEAVVFDIGNVLLHWDPHAFYDRVIGPERRAALFAAVDLDGMNEQVDLGADFRATIYAKAEEHPDFGDEIRMWHDRWIEMAEPGIDHSMHLMRTLQGKGVPVFSLSNFGVDSYVVAAQRYPILNEFDRDFVSGHLKMIKPDAAIYEVLETQSGVAPGALLFTDDRADNISAAQARGWRTHLFEGPEGWAARLVAESLLTAEEASMP